MSRLNKRPTVTGTPTVKQRKRDRSPAVDISRPTNPKVHAPRDPSNRDDFALFVSSLNNQLTVISDQLTQLKANSITPGDYLRKDELDAELEELNQAEDQYVTSEGGDEIEPKSKKQRRSSRRRRRVDDLAEAAITNASPVVAPPNVAAVSSIGSVAADQQIRFSYQDHTHGGVVGSTPNSGNAGEILFYTSTFEVDGVSDLFWIDAAKQLRVGPVGNRIIVNYIRSKIMGIPLAAGVTGRPDLAFRRVYLAPRGVGAV